MGCKPEKVCKRNTSPTEKREAKRAVRRKRRRSEKKNPESAPIRLRELTEGWTD